MKSQITNISLLLLLFITACTIKPEAIQYGDDACHFCRMTIVDKVHAAELVTKKGKIFKFDATECMINYMQTVDTTSVALFLTSNYNAPTKLIDAKLAHYIITENIPSPMGANLTSVATLEEAEKIKTKKQGELYTWETLLKKLTK